MNAPDYFPRAILTEGTPDTIVLHDATIPNPTPAPEPCCDLQYANYVMSNGVVEMADSIEEYDQAVGLNGHPQHLKLRVTIKKHNCITAQLWETVKGFWWADKFEEACGL